MTSLHVRASCAALRLSGFTLRLVRHTRVLLLFLSTCPPLYSTRVKTPQAPKNQTHRHGNGMERESESEIVRKRLDAGVGRVEPGGRTWLSVYQQLKVKTAEKEKVAFRRQPLQRVDVQKWKDSLLLSTPPRHPHPTPPPLPVPTLMWASVAPEQAFRIPPLHKQTGE